MKPEQFEKAAVIKKKIDDIDSAIKSIYNRQSTQMDALVGGGRMVTSIHEVDRIDFCLNPTNTPIVVKGFDNLLHKYMGDVSDLLKKEKEKLTTEFEAL